MGMGLEVGGLGLEPWDLGGITAEHAKSAEEGKGR